MIVGPGTKGAQGLLRGSRVVAQGFLSRVRVG